MSFLPAVRRQTVVRPPTDPVRVTLEYLLQHAVGRNNPVTLKKIVSHLQSRGLAFSETKFQQTVLAESRSGDDFIGSSSRGYFLVATDADAKTMRDFYETRIRAETHNLANLKRQAGLVGWNI